MKVKPEQIQPPIVHEDYDDYDEEQLDETINMFVKKTAALYTCTVIYCHFLLFSLLFKLPLCRLVANPRPGKASANDKTYEITSRLATSAGSLTSVRNVAPWRKLGTP